MSALLVACSGHVDDASLPVLTVSDTEIDLSYESQAVFTVTYDGVDVTSESELFSTLSSTELVGNVFTPLQTGSALFYAVYGGKQSESVKVEVIDSKPKVDSKYDRHVCLMEFTGAWCVNCPDGYDNIVEQFSRTLAKFKENVHLCSFHTNAEGTDSLAIPATQDVYKVFSALSTYPSYAVDMRDTGSLLKDGMTSFKAAITASMEEYLPHCGVAVSSFINDGKAKVTVKVASEMTTSYRVVVLVVQDRILGYQNTNRAQGAMSDYPHRHVVRQVVTHYDKSLGFTGEKLTENGLIAAGSEAEKFWDVQIDSRWVLENTQIYALALDANGYVNNMNICAIDGGDSGFDLK